MDITSDLKNSNNFKNTIHKNDTYNFYFSFENLDIINNFDLKVFFISNVLTSNKELTAVKNINDNKFEFSQSNLDTSNYSVGDYKVYFKFYTVDEVYTVDSNLVLSVKENILNTVNVLSHNKKVLEALKATIEKKATYDQTSYTFNGISITRLDSEKLLYWKNQYELLVQKEEEEEKRKAGLVSKKLNKIKVRFV